MRIALPYGSTHLPLDVDANSEVLEASDLISAGDEDEIVLKAMAQPITSPTLYEMALGKKNAVLLISDHTRPVPSKRILPHMLEQMRRASPDIDITLLVATGCHRGTSVQELRAKLGEDIVRSERILIHDCDQSPLVDLGALPSGARLVVNKFAADAELLIAEGFIEPHFFAGFSGGRKSVLPGICARQTVLGNHCAAFNADENARGGILDNNPIHRDMQAAVKMCGLDYIVNVIIDAKKRVVSAFCGHPIKAHEAGCAYLSARCRVQAKQKGDIVITTNGGAPLDQNIYQAVKGLSTAEAAAAEKAILIIAAACEDGAGGEHFYKALRDCQSPASLYEAVAKIPMEQTQIDQWQYQILARILMKHRVFFVTDPSLAPIVADMKMEYFKDIKSALAKAHQIQGEDAHVLIIPDGVSVIAG